MTTESGLDDRVASAVIVRFSWLFSLAVGLCVLAGWTFGIESLKSLFPGWISMKANTALCFIFAGISLGLWIESSGRKRLLALGFAGFVFLVSLLSLAEYLFAREFHIDQFLFEDRNPTHTAFPGRMAPMTAVNFILTAVALMTLDKKARVAFFSQLFAFTVVFTAVLAMVGYFYDVRSLYNVFMITPVAFHTAVTFLVLGLGIVFAQPDEWLKKILFSDLVGSVIARRLIPLVIIVPFVLGWLELKGQQARMYETEFGTAIIVVLTNTFFVALILFHARLLNRSDEKRKKLQNDIHAADTMKESLLSAARLGLSIVDEQGSILFTNAYMKELANGEIVGKRCWEVYKDDHTQCSDCPLREPIMMNSIKRLQTHGVFGGRAYEISHVGILYEGKKAMFEVFQDITERKQTQDELQASERKLQEAVKRFHLVSRATSDVIYDWDMQTNRLWFNENLNILFGIKLSQDDFTIDWWADRIHPADRTRVFESLQAVQESSTDVWQGEYRLQRSDGMYFDVLDRGYFVRDESGRAIRMIGSKMDISDRKEAQDKLLKSEDRFRSIFQLVPVSIWEEDWTSVIGMIRKSQNESITDYAAYFRRHPEFVSEALQKVKILDVNNATLEIFKATTKDQMLSSLTTVFATPDTLPGFEAELIALANGKHFFETEMSLRTVDNSLIHVLLTMTFPPPGSQSGTVLVSLMDISSRRHAEEALKDSERRFRATFETAAIGVAIVSLEGKFLRVNQTLADIVGYTGEELQGLTFQEITHPEDLASDLSQVNKLLSDELKSYTLEKRYIRKDGSTVWISLSASLVRTAGGKPGYFIATVEDITERKAALGEIVRLNVELENRVKQRTAQLEASNKELEAFAYSVSHDLRAPLRSIDGFSQALLEDYADKLNDHGKSNLRRVRAASQRMAQLIDDLLQISRVTRAEMNLQRVNLSALAEEVAEELHKDDSARRVEFHIQPDLFADVDAPLMRIVLENLLGNAWKFTSKNPTARIEFGRIEKSGKPVFYIRDDGAGFDMQYADKLFEAFQRLHNAQEFPGTGIGLTSVQRILSRHGGEIWAEAEVDHGATFFFTLS